MTDTQQPKTHYLTDYQPPVFLVDTVDLDITLDETQTKVVSQLTLRRNPNAADSDAPLFLNGHNLTLIALAMNGIPLSQDAFDLTEEGLTIADAPEALTLTIETRINPKENTELLGLYLSSGNYCTQCEAEGFRRITYYPDRPDVMAKFTTTIRGDKKTLPHMLSNGNPTLEGVDENGLDFISWEDPFRKPAYLFALVAGDLAFIEDRFKTVSGKDVTLRIYTEHGKESKAGHAMEALKISMKWDEEAFGREYDLDLFNIVAVSDFTMGAMENKSLNIFNDKYILADPRTATDVDYDHIEGVVAHEYFHNWTGNRITCQNWFNLTLKEGLTVYRDQEFSADVRSRAVKRIGDVQRLRAGQFREDAGSMAHPIRPDSYQEIDNFYSATVYEKGAEIIRMQEKLVGKETFRKGMDIYFDRHDGQAVTCEDFLQAIEDGSGKDLTQFRLWYAQAGTPEITATGNYDADACTYTVTFAQDIPDTPGQTQKKPMLIPMEIGLVDKDGADMPLLLVGEEGSAPTSRVLELTKDTQSFIFEDIKEAPVLSVNRGFGAPVKMTVNYSDADYAHLMAHDSDPFARWEAGQQYATQKILAIVANLKAGKEPTVPQSLVRALGTILQDKTIDDAFKAEALVLPTRAYLGDQMDIIDIDAIKKARNIVRTAFAETYRDDILKLYADKSTDTPFAPTADQAGQRALRNACLGYMALLQHDTDLQDMVAAHYAQASNMTDKMAALGTMVHTHHFETDAMLEDFYETYRDDQLVVNKWLALHASVPAIETTEKVKSMMQHESFSIKNPNKVYALLGGYVANMDAFHDDSGAGYRFLGACIEELDALNPTVAARFAPPLTRFNRYDSTRSALMKQEVKRLLSASPSKNVREILQKSIDSNG